MKKILKKMSVLAVCVFALVAICTLCSKTEVEPTSNVNVKVILPTPVREGDSEEGVFIG